MSKTSSTRRGDTTTQAQERLDYTVSSDGQWEFSKRWGIPVRKDEGFTQVYNFLLHHYHRIGVKPVEFIVILHLASYKYESAGSECRPDTIAEQMGFTRRYVRKIIADLEGRGLLQRQLRPPRTTKYDVSGFGRAVLEALKQEEEQRVDESTNTSEPEFHLLGTRVPPTRNPSSAEEEDIKNSKNNDIKLT